jgi:uncharacterized membrane protein
MDNVSLILGLSNLFSGLLILGLMWPLYQGRIGRNSLYGVRTKKTLSSDEVWYAVNKYAAQRMLPYAAMIAGIGAAAFFLPLKQNPALAMVIGLVPLVVLIPCLQSWRYSQQFQVPAKKKSKRK